jgi:hypothetical protein
MGKPIKFVVLTRFPWRVCLYEFVAIVRNFHDAAQCSGVVALIVSSANLIMGIESLLQRQYDLSTKLIRILRETRG